MQGKPLVKQDTYSCGVTLIAAGNWSLLLRVCGEVHRAKGECLSPSREVSETHLKNRWSKATISDMRPNVSNPSRVSVIRSQIWLLIVPIIWKTRFYKGIQFQIQSKTKKKEKLRDRHQKRRKHNKAKVRI